MTMCMRNILVVFVLLTALKCHSQSTLELLSNYETVGINVILDTIDEEKDAFGTVQYKHSSDTEWSSGFPLSRIENDLNMCSGSIFWLSSGEIYDVRVTLIDSTTSAINGQLLAGTISTRSELSPTSTGQIYHVSPDGNNGTYTIQDAFNLVRAGEKVLIANGTYYVGDLVLPNNGTLAKPIVIIGESTENVIFNGAYEEQLNWTAFGNNGVYVTNTPVINPNLVIADGERLFPHQTYPDLRNNQITATLTNIEPAGMSGFYRNPTLLPFFPSNFGDPGNISVDKLYVKFLDNSDPNEKDMVVTNQSRALTLDNNEFIILKNITFKNYGVGHVATAVIISNSHQILIDSCTFEANNTCISLKGKSERVTIQHSTFMDYFINWHSWKIKATHDYEPLNQRFPQASRNLEKGGFVCDHDFFGKEIVIRGNTFDNFHQTGRLTPTRPGVSPLDTLPVTLEIDFYNNLIKNSSGDGFEIDNYARNIRVFNNRFESCHAPLSLAAAEDGPSYIIRNVFTDIVEGYYISNFTLLQAKGHPLKFQHGKQNSVNGDIFFFHNTVDAKNIAFGMNLSHTTVSEPWKKLELKNNIFKTDSGISMNIRAFSLPRLESNYNAYYSNNSDISCVEINNSSPECYSSITDIHSSYSWEEHSFESHPLFLDETNGNYTLSGDSPLINKGVLIQGINDKSYFGNSPDIGAFEYSNTTSNNETLNTAGLTISPNPSSGTFVVSVQMNFINSPYFIYDTYGRLIQKGIIPPSSNLDVNIEHLNNGLYFFRIETDNMVEVARIIKCNK